MRLIALALFGFALSACGDDDGSSLVSHDVAPGIDEGCVVTEPRDSARPRTWTVREGDSLRRIAQRVYGNESLWKAIRDANPGKVADGDVIAPGTELTIPHDGI